MKTIFKYGIICKCGKEMKYNWDYNTFDCDCGEVISKIEFELGIPWLRRL